MASTGIYTTLLQNAGFTEEEWGMRVAMQAEAVNVMASRILTETLTQGSKFHVPKLSTWSAAGTITRGAGGNEGQSNTNYTVIGDADAEITPITAYSKVLLPVTVASEILNGSRAPMWEEALRTRMAQALGKEQEVRILGRYVDSTLTSVGDDTGYHCMMFSREAFALGTWVPPITEEVFDPDVDSYKIAQYMDSGVVNVWPTYVVDYIAGATPITWDGFLDCYNALNAVNAPKPYSWVVYAGKAKQVFQVPEFWQASIQGDAGAVVGRTGDPPRPLGVEIVFSTNVVNA